MTGLVSPRPVDPQSFGTICGQFLSVSLCSGSRDWKPVGGARFICLLEIIVEM